MESEKFVYRTDDEEVQEIRFLTPLKLLAEFKIPIRLVSEMNRRDHRMVLHKRKKSQQLWTTVVFPPHLRGYGKPVSIHLTRIGPRMMDKGNNVASFKHVEDALADLIFPGLAAGRADQNINFTWSQHKGKPKEYAVLVQIFE